MKILKFLDDHFEEALIGAGLVIITAVMGAQIICRTFGSSIRWAEELCRYVFVWCGGLGISYATKTETHLRLDVIPNLFPKLKKPYEIIADVALLVFACYMLKPGITVLSLLLETGQTSAAMKIPMAYVYFAVLLGCILTVVRLVEKYIKLAIAKKKGV